MFQKNCKKFKNFLHPKQWPQISTYLNPANYGTCGLETNEIQQKWLELPQIFCENELAWNEINKQQVTCAAVSRSPKMLFGQSCWQFEQILQREQTPCDNCNSVQHNLSGKENTNEQSTVNN